LSEDFEKVAALIHEGHFVDCAKSILPSFAA
jgi:hypothetical protein